MKFFPLSSNVARQMLVAATGKAAGEVPFVVNQQEAAIIDYPQSVFILGRSGRVTWTRGTGHRLFV